MTEKLKLRECPFCGQTPDIAHPYTFQSNQGTKWGYVVCCCQGPEVRTGYGPVEEWRDDAITAWNTRAHSPDLTQLVKAAREAFESLKRHIPEAHGVHPNPEYQIVEDMAAALVPFKEVE